MPFLVPYRDVHVHVHGPQRPRHLTGRHNRSIIGAVRIGPHNNIIYYFNYTRHGFRRIHDPLSLYKCEVFICTQKRPLRRQGAPLTAGCRRRARTTWTWRPLIGRCRRRRSRCAPRPPPRTPRPRRDPPPPLSRTRTRSRVLHPAASLLEYKIVCCLNARVTYSFATSEYVIYQRSYGANSAR